MIVNIAGLAGAGKDTVASALAYLFERDGVAYKIVRYAAPLKNAAHMLFGIGFDDREAKEVPVSVPAVALNDVVEATFKALGLESPQKCWSFTHFGYAGKTIEVSPRRFQQVLGTEIVRAVKDSAWVDVVARQNEPGAVLIVPDCRFPNEVAVGNGLVDVYNVYVHRVMRPEQLVAAHSSEALALRLYDLVETLGMPPYVHMDLDRRDHRFDVVMNPGQHGTYFGNQMRSLAKRIVQELEP